MSPSINHQPTTGCSQGLDRTRAEGGRVLRASLGYHHAVPFMDDCSFKSSYESSVSRLSLFTLWITNQYTSNMPTSISSSTAGRVGIDSLVYCKKGSKSSYSKRTDGQSRCPQFHFWVSKRTIASLCFLQSAKNKERERERELLCVYSSICCKRECEGHGNKGAEPIWYVVGQPPLYKSSCTTIISNWHKRCRVWFGISQKLETLRHLLEPSTVRRAHAGTIILAIQCVQSAMIIYIITWYLTSLTCN